MLYWIVGGFIVVIAFLLWANYRMEIARERQETYGDESDLFAVANHAWKTGKPCLGTMDDEGKLTITTLESKE